MVDLNKNDDNQVGKIRILYGEQDASK